MRETSEPSNKHFWKAMKEGGGRYSEVSAILANKYGYNSTILYIHQRALEKPEKLKELEDLIVASAEQGLYDLMGSPKDEVKLRAIMFYLKSKGKGYDEKPLDKEGENKDKITGIRLISAIDSNATT